MATPAERFESWMNGLAVKWRTAVANWSAELIGRGVEVFADILARSYSRKAQALLNSMEKVGDIPAELQPFFDEAKNPTGEAAAAVLGSLGNRAMGGITGSFMEVLLRPYRYKANRTFPTEQIGVDMALAGWLRGYVDDASLEYILDSSGFDKWHKEVLKKSLRVVLPSDIALPAWLRDKERFQWAVDQLPKLGLDDKTIDLLKELAYVYPSPQQAITWMAREVFEDDMAAKYGLDDESDKIDYSFMEKIGIKEEIARKHWRAHWEHASWTQVQEMLHRGAMTEADVYDWFRLVEIPPYWRKGLTKTMWNLPGRVEIRLMARYGLVTKAEILELLKADGLTEQYRDLVADMMLAQGVMIDLGARYRNGWIDKDGVKAELAAAGISAERVERMFQWIVKNAKAEVEPTGRDLTKAEIIKALRRGLVSRDDAVQQLRRMNYSPEEVDLLLALDQTVEPSGAPELVQVQVDTLRRRRRKRLITRPDEIQGLIRVGVDAQLAAAYADNDDERLVKAASE